MGRETILFIDDEEMIVRIGKRTLQLSGYKVLTAQSGDEALSVFTEHQKEIELVVADLTLPGGGGMRVVEELARMAPHLQVVIISGADEETVSARVKNNVKAYLLKPFLPQQLSCTVRAILEKANGVCTSLLVSSPS